LIERVDRDGGIGQLSGNGGVDAMIPSQSVIASSRSAC
jgi:hypothetical protein